MPVLGHSPAIKVGVADLSCGESPRLTWKSLIAKTVGSFNPPILSFVYRKVQNPARLPDPPSRGALCCSSVCPVTGQQYLAMHHQVPDTEGDRVLPS